MKAVDLLINSLIPEDVRDYSRVYDKKGISNLLSELGQKHPDEFADIVQKISNVGRMASWKQGETLTLDDMKPVIDKDKYIQEMENEVLKLEATISDPKKLRKAKTDLYEKYTQKMQEGTVKGVLKNKTNLGFSILSGARGNPTQLRSMIAAPGLFVDSNNEPVPVFIGSSFGEGIRPYEYLAGSYGARQSVVSTKKSTAEAGSVGKQLNQMAAHMIVTEDDCGTSNAIDLEKGDPSLRGRVLSRDVGEAKAGTVVDKEVENYLRKMKGIDKVMARSPLTCQSKHGVCKKCLGAGPGGQLHPLGYAAGINAGSAIGEPLAQSGLNAKHTSGASKGAARLFSGFDVLNTFLQSPETFPNRAAVAEKHGKVESIEDAPQGGFYITVDGEQHYSPADFPPIVSTGDTVEAGDALTEGIVDPADMVRLRGLGEGRRYYANRLKQILDDSGLDTNLRRTEVLARAALDHMNIGIDPNEHYLPGDTISYNDFVNNYAPPPDTVSKPIHKDLAGKYLQTPLLQYSIGTKITPRMLEHMKENGYNEISVSDTEPYFEPEMVALQRATHNNKDWLARLGSSYLKEGLTTAGIRGDETNVQENVHYVPRLAVGKDFGDKLENTGKF